MLALKLAPQRGASVTSVLAGVSRALGNMPAVCRKSYVHPAVLDALGAGDASPRAAPAGDGLRAAEQRLLRLLRSRLRTRGHNAPC